MSQPSYSGYYYKGDNSGSDEAHVLIASIKGSAASVGDYLLLATTVSSVIDSIALYKVTAFNEGTSEYTDTPISLTGSYIFYAVSASIDGSPASNKILDVDTTQSPPTVDDSLYSGGSFDSDNMIFNGLAGNDSGKPSSPSDYTLYLSIDNDNDKNILSIFKDTWKPVITGLSQFQYVSDSDDNYQVILESSSEHVDINKLDNSLSFNGYYSGDNTDSDPNYHEILYAAKGGVYSEIDDYLLLKNTVSGTTTISLLKVKSLSNPFDNDDFAPISMEENYLFYSVNGDADQNPSNKILYVDVTALTVTISSINNGDFEDIKRFVGLYGGLTPIDPASSTNGGTLYFNKSITLKTLLKQSYETDEDEYNWIPVFNGLKLFNFSSNNGNFEITVFTDNSVDIQGLSFNYNSFNGYYSGDNTDETPNYHEILYSLKNNVDSEIGDYLLFNNTFSSTTTISLLKFTTLSNPLSNNNFTLISTGDYYLFYSVNGDADQNPSNKVLYVDKTELTVTISSINNGDFNFDADKNSNGLVGSGETPGDSPSSGNVGTLYLNSDSTTETTTLKQSYQTAETPSEVYSWIPVFTGLTWSSFDTEVDDDIYDRYIIYINQIDTGANVAKVNYAETPYTGYQGFFYDTIAAENYSTISATIKLQNGGRDIILGDTLLSKYSTNNYTIYVICAIF